MSGSNKKQWKGRRGAQPVSDLVAKLLNPVIERRAGMTTDLVASWEEIVGERHSSLSKPEKLQWPRQASDDDPFEPATLVLACESVHAVFLQHDTTTIIAAINSYFGFTAVARIKIMQKPVTKLTDKPDRVRPELNETQAASVSAILTDIEDPNLRAALEKMGKGVFSNRS